MVIVTTTATLMVANTMHALIKSASAAVSLPPNEKLTPYLILDFNAKMTQISIFLQ